MRTLTLPLTALLHLDRLLGRLVRWLSFTPDCRSGWRRACKLPS